MENLSALQENPLTCNVMLSQLHKIQSGQMENQRLSMNPSLSFIQPVSVSQYSIKPINSHLNLDMNYLYQVKKVFFRVCCSKYSNVNVFTVFLYCIFKNIFSLIVTWCLSSQRDLSLQRLQAHIQLSEYTIKCMSIFEGV